MGWAVSASDCSELMTVGELSRRTGVSTKNLRAYTDQGLIYSVGRTAANYRLYDSEALWCVAVIAELRQLGLTVAEIDEFVRGNLDADGQGNGEPIGPRLAPMLDMSRARVERQIAELVEVRRRIDAFVADHRSELGDPSARYWPGDPRARDSRA